MDGPLVRAARGGSQSAFARLVTAHERSLRGFLRKSGFSDADDIAQEAFLAAWSSLGRLRDDDGFRAWLFGIAWRKALDQGRAARRAAHRDEVWREEQAADAPREVDPADRLAAGGGPGRPAARPAGLRHPLPGPGLVARRGGGNPELAAGHREVACEPRT
ncbi:RNA polymerase sigma factor (sigma-70 family) [Caulobacter rhizosphaerae]|jgi:RNA polymerase sigma-70 factor (ECF subfamily)|uniref:RNA polymerase sigma factor n=1 Tax=Caulobacter rhizosphaerae TaxID=2010972 RepID=A0ABU1N787_9CAUL|nr:RNA polymerase sigma factor (sigma-70 family) [Caulobacter rhizosphaerae]